MPHSINSQIKTIKNNKLCIQICSDQPFTPTFICQECTRYSIILLNKLSCARFYTGFQHTVIPRCCRPTLIQLMVFYVEWQFVIKIRCQECNNLFRFITSICPRVQQLLGVQSKGISFLSFRASDHPILKCFKLYGEISRYKLSSD